MLVSTCCINFFFDDTPTTEIYTLSLHDALPISPGRADRGGRENRKAGDRRARRRQRDRHALARPRCGGDRRLVSRRDRKSTRLNSSHRCISYAVFCLKKKTALA